MPNDAVFPDVKPFPGEEAVGSEGHAHPRFDNQPPLEERVAMEFEDQLRDAKLLERIQEITESGGRVPEITGAIAGRVGDLIRMGRECRKAVEDHRETNNRPLLTAQRALKARADTLLKPMDDVLQDVKRRLDAFVFEEDRKRRDAQRLADEEARKAREAAEAARAKAEEAGEPVADIPAPVIEAPQIQAPTVRGDLGTCVSTRTVWKHEITCPIKSLPKAILENAQVVEAINKVIAAQVRAGTREIKGVRIWDEPVANVR